MALLAVHSHVFEGVDYILRYLCFQKAGSTEDASHSGARSNTKKAVDRFVRKDSSGLCKQLPDRVVEAQRAIDETFFDPMDGDFGWLKECWGSGRGSCSVRYGAIANRTFIISSKPSGMVDAGGSYGANEAGRSQSARATTCQGG